MRLPTVGTARIIPSNPKQAVLSLPILILLFLILVAILGGFYYWYTIVMSQAVTTADPLARPTTAENNEPESTTAEARTQVLDVVSTSDEVGSIKSDIDSTNLGDLDAEVNPIEAELDAALE